MSWITSLGRRDFRLERSFSLFALGIEEGAETRLRTLSHRVRVCSCVGRIRRMCRTTVANGESQLRY
jgi:hypothetical protein